MTKVGTKADFDNFAKNHVGVSSLGLNRFDNSVATPYILEKSEMRATQIDIFSRLMADRIIYVAGEIDDNTSIILSAQLMYLDRMADVDINLYLDSPGGSVKSGLTILDTMEYIACDVATMNLGNAASMASVLLASGEKGKRASLKHSKVMLHKVSGGMQGNVEDVKILFNQMEDYNKELIRILSEKTGNSIKTLSKDIERDLWLSAEEAKKYGVIDLIVTKREV